MSFFSFHSPPLKFLLNRWQKIQIYPQFLLMFLLDLPSLCPSLLYAKIISWCAHLANEFVFFFVLHSRLSSAFSNVFSLKSPFFYPKSLTFKIITYFTSCMWYSFYLLSILIIPILLPLKFWCCLFSLSWCWHLFICAYLWPHNHV